MAKKTTLDKLNKPATVIVKFGGEKVKFNFSRLSELFAELNDNGTIEKHLIVATRKQLGYDRPRMAR
jgi:hypothetical protein